MHKKIKKLKKGVTGYRPLQEKGVGACWGSVRERRTRMGWGEQRGVKEGFMMEGSSRGMGEQGWRRGGSWIVRERERGLGESKEREKE